MSGELKVAKEIRVILKLKRKNLLRTLRIKKGWFIVVVKLSYFGCLPSI